MNARTILRYRKKEGWKRWKGEPGEEKPSPILLHARKEVERVNDKAQRSIGEAIQDVVNSHKASSEALRLLLHEAMVKILGNPHKDPFRQMLTIKVASEIAHKVQQMDRKTWGLDDVKDTKTTQIFDVLKELGDPIPKQSVASGSKITLEVGSSVSGESDGDA